MKEYCALEDSLKISMRAKRHRKEGKGWYTITVQGPGGYDVLEIALKQLLRWRPDFDIDAVDLPTFSDEFSQQKVFDVFGNVKEYILRSGAVLVDAQKLSVRVTGHGHECVVLRSHLRRKLIRPKASESMASVEPGFTKPARWKLTPRIPDPPPPPLPPPPPPPPEPAPSNKKRKELDADEPTVSVLKQSDPSAGVTAVGSDVGGKSSNDPAPKSAGAKAKWKQRPSAGVTAVVAASSSSSIDPSPNSQVAASGLRVAVQLGYKLTKMTLPAIQFTMQSEVDVPPYWQVSSEQLALLQTQQRLNVNVGVDRVKLVGLPELPDASVRVAFCCHVLRRPTVAMALKINFALTWKRRANITWFFVDFNADDVLQNDILETLRPAIETGHLKYFRSGDLQYWHACIGKNTSHMIPDDKYDTLVCVDGDNILTLEFVEQALVMAARIKASEVGCVQFLGPGEAGTYGRIMIGRALFHKLGGYDEDFHPVGCQDTDLIYRVVSCENVGTSVRVEANVGTSIDNKPGTDWSKCIKEKVSNTDPVKYHGWKFWKMDQQNRIRMYELLQNKIVQRNQNRTIGVKTTLVELPPVPEEYNEDVGDYDRISPSVSSAGESEAGVSPGEEVLPRPPGGVTPEPKMRQGKFEFKIATFGCEQLAKVENWRNTAANDLRNEWLHTRGKAPKPFDERMIQAALANCWERPDVIVDARCFRPPPYDQGTGAHMGHSYELSKRLIDDDRIFRVLWRDALRQIHGHAGGLRPVNIAFFCRAGEKRSVGIAWMLSAALRQHLGWIEAAPVRHLCDRLWTRKTCAGWQCHECDLQSPWHAELIQRLAPITMQVMT